MQDHAQAAESTKASDDLSGVWEVNYKYSGIDADLGLSYQALVVVHGDRLLGFDAIGGTWSGNFFSDEEGLAVRLRVDIRGVLGTVAIPVATDDTSGPVSVKEMVVRLETIGEGGALAGVGRWQEGDAGLEAALRRRIKFDGPGF